MFPTFGAMICHQYWKKSNDTNSRQFYVSLTHFRLDSALFGLEVKGPHVSKKGSKRAESIGKQIPPKPIAS